MNNNKKIYFNLQYLPFIEINGQIYEQREQVVRFESFKAWVNSDEMNKHNRPHLHIEFCNIEYVCSIDDVIEILEPENTRNSIKKYIINVVIKNLKTAREKWNKIISKYKFTDEQLSLKNYIVSYSSGIAKVLLR